MRVKKTALEPRLLTTLQVSQLFGVNRSTIHRLRTAGELPAICHWKQIRFDIKDVEAWIERNKVVAKPVPTPAPTKRKRAAVDSLDGTVSVPVVNR